jgi:hypothetical protein
MQETNWELETVIVSRKKAKKKEIPCYIGRKIACGFLLSYFVAFNVMLYHFLLFLQFHFLIKGKGRWLHNWQFLD